MKLLVTGANGFLGRYVVAEALRRGHGVRAMVRSAADAARHGWDREPNVEVVVADLRRRKGLAEAIAGTDAVLHLAAAKAGDMYAQYGGTVVATENLLAAMAEANVRRVVCISSFSVYDYMRIPHFAVVDESSPVEADAFDRDEYAHTKLVQERLVRDAAAAGSVDYTILRPGVIYGRDNAWTARLGMKGGRVWVRTGAWARLPLTYVENCAEAIVRAAEVDAAKGQTLNVVDDDMPTQRRYAALLRKQTSPPPVILPVAYSVMRGLAGLAMLTNKVLLGGKAKIPGIFVPCRLVARCKPLRYSNRRIKEVLGWTPRYGLNEALDRTFAKDAPSQPVPAKSQVAPAVGEHGVGATSQTVKGGGMTAADGLAPGNANGATPPAAANTQGAAPLRIAYMTGQYPRATDTFIQREVAALRAHGVHVETFSIRKPHDKENVGPETAAERQRTFYVLPACPLALLKAHAKLLLSGPGRYLRAVRTMLTVRPPGAKAFVWALAYFAEAGIVAERVKRLGVVHLHNHFSNSSCSAAMLAAEMGGFSFSFTMHGPAEFYEPKYWRLDEKIRRALFVACISHFARSQGMVFGPQTKWDQMHIVHCGVDPALFAPVRHEGAGKRLLFVGRLAGVKGLPVLLQSLARVKRSNPDVHLTVAGDGPDRELLTKQARDLGVKANVTFLGYQSQAQVRELLARTDVFVMASFAEGVPVVLMEAMAAGVPVVATQIAGVPELVDDGESGFLVPPGDPNLLAERVERLLADAELRNAFGGRGRAKVEREFDINREAEWLCRILTSALAGRVAGIREEPPARDGAETPSRAVPAPVPAERPAVQVADVA